MTRRGFKPLNYVLYDLAENDIDDYVPDNLWSSLCRTNGRLGIHILGSKLLFHQTFEDDLTLATLHGHISQGRFTPRRRDVAHDAPAEDDALLELLAQLGSLVVKPVDGQKGKSVHVLRASGSAAAAGDSSPLTTAGEAPALASGGATYQGTSSVELDGRPLSPAQFTDWLNRQDCLLVHSRVQQSDYAANIFPGSANTVRVVTVTDEDGPFTLCASHRSGSKASAPVDNFSAGGLLCGIDLATGRLSQGASLPASGEHSLKWQSVHPDTDTHFAGQVVPGFFELLDLLLATCRRHPYLAYVGWDVVMTDSGPVVLEANYGSGLQLQLSGGFLRNQRFARFVEAAGATRGGARR